ncbi:pentapeptide repeat-containing protein [Streptomyces formicae]
MNFTGKNLKGADFSGLDLSKKSFRDAELLGADFDGANLRDVDGRGQRQPRAMPGSDTLLTPSRHTVQQRRPGTSGRGYGGSHARSRRKREAAALHGRPRTSKRQTDVFRHARRAPFLRPLLPLP